MECKVGFSRVVITPPLGVGLAGYFEERYADGVLDELEANCIAVNDGSNTAIVMSCDLLYGDQDQMDCFRKQITAETGVPYEAIFIACTHTHTGPYVKGTYPVADVPYLHMLSRKLAAAAALAIADLAPATAEIGRTIVKDISFVRRFLMKDGTIRTNPGLQNPEIAHPIGEPDETLQVLRFCRTGAPDIIIANFQVHPDTVGGRKFSADYPRFVRETVEKVLPDVRCVYFNGAQGDTNHLDVRRRPDFYAKLAKKDPRSYAMHMGRSIAGGVLQICDVLTPVALGEVRFGQSNISVPTNRGREDEIPEAQRISDLHDAGRDDEIPGEGMNKTTLIAKSRRILLLKDGPDALTLYISGVRFGDVAFAGLPGEPFTELGRDIKARSPYEMTIPCCCTNGGQGYYPVYSAYAEGGYEANNSKFASCVAEHLTNGAVSLLEQLQ